MITLYPPKLPGETRTYQHSFAAFLGEDMIATLNVESDDVIISGDTIEDDDQSVSFSVAGGTLGEPALITMSIVSTGGLEETESFLLPISADEPVSITEAKSQCRMLEDDSEDAFIASLISPARAYVERVSRRLFIGGERTETFRAWGDYLDIWRQPVASVDAITYSTSGDPADDEAYTGFVANVGSFPVRISPGDSGFPDLVTGGTITVTYTAGAVSATSEEYLIGKRAMLLLIGHWFENREGVVLGVASAEVDFALREMLNAISPIPAY